MAEEFACCSAGIIRLFLAFFCPIAGLQLSTRKFKIIDTASFLSTSLRSLKEGPSKTPYRNILLEAVFGKVQMFWVLRELPGGRGGGAHLLILAI